MSLKDLLRRRYVASDTDVEADDLRDRTGRLGVASICDVPDRAMADVWGVVRSVTLPAVVDGPVRFVADLYDGSAAVEVVWMGRREVPGIEPGTSLRVQGRVSRHGRMPRIFNPRYEILPSA